MEKIYDLAVKVGEYQKNGETKAKWENIGAVMEGDKGPFIMLKKTFNPAGLAEQGRESILVSCFEAKKHNQVKPTPVVENNPFAYDDIPF
jgi:hypothetical protein